MERRHRRAAVAAVIPMRPKRVTVAVPIGSPRAVVQLGELVDEVVCPWQPEDFRAVGEAYEVFDHEDEEVKALLTQTMGTDVPPQE